MEKFTLKEYLKNPEREVVKSSGTKIRIICTDRKNSSCPIVALVPNGQGYEDIELFSENGETLLGERGECVLFFRPVKHEGWVNIYQSGKVCGGGIYATEEEAKKNSAHGYMTTAKIEWTE